MVLVDKGVEGRLSMSVVVHGAAAEFESFRVSSFFWLQSFYELLSTGNTAEQV